MFALIKNLWMLEDPYMGVMLVLSKDKREEVTMNQCESQSKRYTKTRLRNEYKTWMS